MAPKLIAVHSGNCYIGGQPYPLTRVPIDDLPDYRRRHNLRPVRQIGLNYWPPIILYERIDDHDQPTD